MPDAASYHTAAITAQQCPLSSLALLLECSQEHNRLALSFIFIGMTRKKKNMNIDLKLHVSEEKKTVSAQGPCQNPSLTVEKGTRA